MRTLQRNKRTFYYCLYRHSSPIEDEYGNETGETLVVYQEPVEMKANVSQAAGQTNAEMFGTLENYDKVIVTSDMSCPIDENTVLFIEKAPEFVGTGDYAIAGEAIAGIAVAGETMVPVYDYIVRRVSKSLNSIAIAIRRVNVS